MNTRRTILAYAFALASLAGCGTTPPPEETASVAPEEWQTCTSPEGYSIGVPPGWFVHPPDAANQVDDCMLFAEQPFAATVDDRGSWVGAQVVAMMIQGCRSFDAVSSERELDVQGFDAWALELSAREGPDAGDVYAYEYFISFAPNRPCEASRYMVLRTERGAPGDLAANKSVLDLMVSTLRFADAD